MWAESIAFFIAAVAFVIEFILQEHHSSLQVVNFLHQVLYQHLLLITALFQSFTLIRKLRVGL